MDDRVVLGRQLVSENVASECRTAWTRFLQGRGIDGHDGKVMWSLSGHSNTTIDVTESPTY
jgi:hypothetical protein